jgi:primosomal protein N' (replication factor Y)
MSHHRIIEVLLPLPFDHGFSYFLPENLEVKIGDVVKVPFRNTEIYGAVTSLTSDDQSLDHKKIKTIISKNDILSVNSKLLEFIKWVANYNLSPLGAVLKLTISILNSDKTKKFQALKKSINPSINLENFNLKLLLDEQQIAADFLIKKIDEKKHSVILLDGVTGSGKTEVYFAAIAEILKKGQGQILILLPEIALTSQLITRFESQFGFTPNLWHSKITPTKKRDIFKGIIDGEIKILIGARSSLFLPFKELSLIIIDEEHDSSFKQEDIVNYHGRDMAVLRGKIEEIPVILSSATPSLESFINAKSGKYEYLNLTRKFSHDKITKIDLIDMRKEKLNKNSHLSSALKKELLENLEHGKQSLLFLNRRGYAPLTLCKNCGHKAGCPNCSSYLTAHKKIDKLICHYCGYSAIPSNKCSSCGSEESLISCGAGVEKIKEEILHNFPESRIAIMTSDNITNLDEAENIIQKILNHEIDIIIGTQIIAKGHHFPSLSLVGIIDGDGSFYNANLRTLEKSYQLLTQVIGRAGRDKYHGKVILQTYNPENLVFQNIIKSSRDEFLEMEIRNREHAEMPPFAKMAAIIVSAIKEKDAIDAAKLILKQFPIQNEIEIFGPAPMPITRIKNRYNYRILVKTKKNINIQKLISSSLQHIKPGHQVRLKIDIDPV